MKKEEKIRLYYGVFLGVFTVVVGVLLIVQAALIYYGGDSPDGKNYTRELAGAKLKEILIPICFYIAAVIAGFVLSVVFPVKELLTVKKSAGETVDKLRRRLPVGESSKEFEQAKKTELARWCVRGASLLVCLAAAIASLVYVCDFAHFAGEDLNSEILNLLKNVLPWVGAAFLVCCGACVFDGIAAKRELQAVKSLLAARRGVPQNGFWFDAKTDACKAGIAAAAKQEKRIVLGIRIAVLALAVAFLIWGALNGGADDVLKKAIKLCTECIGLG